jgi:chromosomal replication initiation ATPase DnaA
MPKGSNDVREILTAVITAYETNDTKEIIGALKSISNKEQEDSIIITHEKIIDEVCIEYKISKQTLMHSNARGHINQARKQTACLIKQILNYSTRKTGKILLCDANTICRAWKYQRELSPKIPEEVIFKQINEKLFNKLNKLNNEIQN